MVSNLTLLVGFRVEHQHDRSQMPKFSLLQFAAIVVRRTVLTFQTPVTWYHWTRKPPKWPSENKSGYIWYRNASTYTALTNTMLKPYNSIPYIAFEIYACIYLIKWRYFIYSEMHICMHMLRIITIVVKDIVQHFIRCIMHYCRSLTLTELNISGNITMTS